MDYLGGSIGILRVQEGGRKVTQGEVTTEAEVSVTRLLALKMKGGQEPKNVGSF